MATENLTIAGEGAEQDGSYVGGAADYTNLNLDDDDTTTLVYNCASSCTYRHSYTVTSFTAGKISNVRFRAKAKQGTSSGNTLKLYVRIGGTNYYGSANELTPSYNYFNQDWATNPATSMPWTHLELNDVEFGIQIAMGAVTDYITYAVAVITYTDILGIVPTHIRVV